ncbi:hypothetical protein ACS0TY_008089 [Phlomoides rotata]
MYTGGLLTESQAAAWHINENEFFAVWKSFKKWHLFLLAKEYTLKVDNTNGSSSFGSSTIHGKAYSREWNSMWHILSLMCLENIHDCGHLEVPTRLPSTGGTSLEPLR